MGVVIGIVFTMIVMLALAKSVAAADRKLEEMQKIEKEDNYETGGT